MAFWESIKARGLAWWRGQSSRAVQAECARSLAEPGCPPKSFSAPQIREDGLLCTSQQPAWPRLLEVTVVTASSHIHPSQCAHQSPGAAHSHDVTRQQPLRLVCQSTWSRWALPTPTRKPRSPLLLGSPPQPGRGPVASPSAACTAPASASHITSQMMPISP